MNYNHGRQLINFTARTIDQADQTKSGKGKMIDKTTC